MMWASICLQTTQFLLRCIGPASLIVGRGERDEVVQGLLDLAQLLEGELAYVTRFPSPASFTRHKHMFAVRVKSFRASGKDGLFLRKNTLRTTGRELVILANSAQVGCLRSLFILARSVAILGQCSSASWLFP
jgi:hypothetical protein